MRVYIATMEHPQSHYENDKVILGVHIDEGEATRLAEAFLHWHKSDHGSKCTAKIGIEEHEVIGLDED